MISDELRSLAKFMTAHKWPIRAQTCNEAAAEFDTMTAQVANAATTSAEQNEAIATLQGQVMTLQNQLLAAQINILSLVILDTHLHGFACKADSVAFLAQQNVTQTPTSFQVTDFTWHPMGSITPT